MNTLKLCRYAVVNIRYVQTNDQLKQDLKVKHICEPHPFNIYSMMLSLYYIIKL